MQKMKIVVVGACILLIVISSGCTSNQTGITSSNENEDDFENIQGSKDTDGDGYNDDIDAFPHDSNEWRDTDNDGIGDNSDAFPNNRYEQYDSDKDGIGNNADAFPYDSTQWADRDNDGYGDNLNGNNPDAFPDDASEWKDSDSDGIGDNADIYDDGNGGIKVKITRFQCDDLSDEIFSKIDPYFKIQIWIIEQGNNEWVKIREEESSIYWDQVLVYNPYVCTVDVKDDIKQVHVVISAWDSDLDADDRIDLNGDNTYLYDVETDFSPKTTSYFSFTTDGRLDLIDELDGWIEYYIQVVGV